MTFIWTSRIKSLIFDIAGAAAGKSWPSFRSACTVWITNRDPCSNCGEGAAGAGDASAPLVGGSGIIPPGGGGTVDMAAADICYMDFRAIFGALP
jgi:hypothetical protein